VLFSDRFTANLLLSLMFFDSQCIFEMPRFTHSKDYLMTVQQFWYSTGLWKSPRRTHRLRAHTRYTFGLHINRAYNFYLFYSLDFVLLSLKSQENAAE